MRADSSIWRLAPGNRPCRSAELSVRLAPSHHLLAVAIKGVVDAGFRRDQLVVVFEPQVSETLSNGIQPRSLGLVPERVVGIGAVDDLGQENDCGIACKAVLPH